MIRAVRELVGSLTQARVQMIAARAIVEAVANDEEDDAERQALELDAQKLRRCMGVIEDVRERHTRTRVPGDEFKKVADFLSSPRGQELLKVANSGE